MKIKIFDQEVNIILIQTYKLMIVNNKIMLLKMTLNLILIINYLMKIMKFLINNKVNKYLNNNNKVNNKFKIQLKISQLSKVKGNDLLVIVKKIIYMKKKVRIINNYKITRVMIWILNLILIYNIKKMIFNFNIIKEIYNILIDFLFVRNS